MVGLKSTHQSYRSKNDWKTELLSLVGYDVQLLEFIETEHTPKNILIRAYFTGRKSSADDFNKYEAFRDLLGAKPFLEKELGF